MSKYITSQISGANPVQAAHYLKTKVIETDGISDRVLVGLTYGSTGDTIGYVDLSDDSLNAHWDSASDNCYRLLRMADGSCVAGTEDITGLGGGNLHRIAADGTTVTWSVHLGANGRSIRALAYDATRDWIIAATNSTADPNIAAYEASTGALVYSRQALSKAIEIYSMTVDSSGELYISGVGPFADDYPCVYHYDITDDTSDWDWPTGNSSGVGYEITINSSDVLLLGTHRLTQWGIGGTSSGVAQLFSLNTDGTENWDYDLGFVSSQADRVYAVEWASDGDAYCGSSNNTVTHDCVIRKINASDQSLDWEFIVANATPGDIESITETEDGTQVYVGGTSETTWTGSGGSAASMWRLSSSTGAVDVAFNWGVTTWAISAKVDGAAAAASTIAETVYVCDGDVKADRDGTLTAPTGGTDALRTDAGRVMAQAAFGGVYMVDGLNKKVYTPAFTGAGTVATWAPTAGALPSSPSLIALYGGRVVLSGDISDPHNWFMSKIADPYDWNYVPTVVDATMAIAGNNADAGLVGDVVNTLIPVSDDILYFGCDSSIHAMSGNPAAGGVIDQVTDEVGMAFGASFTNDPFGNLYFFGSDRGVYRMSKDGQFDNLSESRINTMLESVDLNTYHVDLAWDTVQKGLYVVIIKDDLSTVSDVFFWEQRADAWWRDEIGNTFDISCMYMYDAEDPDDRTLIMGCTDGYARYPDLTADADDGDPIEAHVRFAPINEGHNLVNTKLSHMEVVMAENSDDVNLRVYAAETPEQLYDENIVPRFTRTVRAGRNPDIRKPVSANAVGVQLFSSGKGRWACDAITGFISRTGRTRRRTRL
jgi:hypothetical protein